ncbi:MAG: glycosyltransferase family 4 protein [Verrucomicrobiae bacterium]|nr:glycosyltransferase family 4 protein [Verrucomicrobiae bacterium]
MTICLVSPSYPSLPAAGGIAVYTQTAARGLAQRGHAVHVLVGLRGTRRDFADGRVQVHVRPVRWLPVLCRWLPGLGESFCLAWHLIRLHRRYRFDVAEFPNWEGPGLVATWLRLVPVVVRLHTSTWETVELANRAPTQNERFLMWAERLSARRANAVVTHSEAHRTECARRLSLGNIEVIPHGIVLPALTGEDLPSESELSVLTVGFLNPRKGTDVFLEAVPLVLREVPNAKFWIVGNDPGSRYEKAFRQRHPHLAREQVTFTGYLPPEELPQYYRQCAVYASASRYESFGLTFVEAMAYGKPVVGCRAGAIPEGVESDTTGILVPPDDPHAFAGAIVDLLRDPERRRRMGHAARCRAEQRFSVEQMVENIERLFQRVAARSTH